jgi:hypothetical protein
LKNLTSNHPLAATLTCIILPPSYFLIDWLTLPDGQLPASPCPCIPDVCFYHSFRAYSCFNMKTVHFFEMLGCDYTLVQVIAEEHNAEQEAV